MAKIVAPIIRTFLGAATGASVALICWILLALLARLDDGTSHWKGTLISFAFILPMLCVTSGVIVFRRHESSPGYTVANLTILLLGTLLTSAAIGAVLSLPFSAIAIVSLPTLAAWAYFEERCLSARVNRCVEWIQGSRS